MRRLTVLKILRSAPLLALGFAALEGTALASPVFELAGASTGTGGFAARSSGPSAASTYFNPAFLPRAVRQFSVGVLVLSDQISMTLDGRTHGDVPLLVGERSAFDPSGNPISNATAPTQWLERGCPRADCGAPPFPARPRQGAGSSGVTRAYTVIGLVEPLYKDRLVLGFYALVPMGDFTTAHSFYNDEREQFFTNSLHPEMYADRMTATSLAFGVGSKIVDRLSAGVSFTLSLTNVASARTYVRDPIDYDKLLISNDIRVKPTVAPHFGLAYDVLDWLHIAGTVHTVQKFVIDTGIAAALPSGNESSTTRSEVHDFLPWTFGLGAAVDLNRGSPNEFTVVGEARYALWSRYLDRHGESPGQNDSGFANVFSETLGLRHSAKDWDSYVDVTYQPTPVPPQTGRSNYVDNDRVGLISGCQHRFPIGNLALKVGIQAQAHRLISRYQHKDDAKIRDELPDDSADSHGAPISAAAGLQTNNPGWPGFASEGWILGGALTASLVY